MHKDSCVVYTLYNSGKGIVNGGMHKVMGYYFVQSF